MNSIPYSVTNGRIDRQTGKQMDIQGQILMPPDYGHRGLKTFRREFSSLERGAGKKAPNRELQFLCLKSGDSTCM